MTSLDTITDEQKARLQSLVKERDELIKKLQKLNSFLYNGEDKSLSYDAQTLLHEQQDCMERYIDILNKRIYCYVKDCTTAATQSCENTTC